MYATKAILLHTVEQIRRGRGLRSDASVKKHRKLRRPAGKEKPQSPRAGYFVSARARAQAVLVAAILALNSSSRDSVMLFGGPPSMISLSGKPWLSNWERPARTRQADVVRDRSTP